MKIGELVKQHIKDIFSNCEIAEHDEIYHLLDYKDSKNMFGVNYPFCTELENIEQSESKRYWTEIYIVRSKRVRVTSQWFEKSRESFLKYIESKGISVENNLENSTNNEHKALSPFKNNSNSRYRGAAIGNSQNLFIRNILSNLGQESFTENDWNLTKDYFLYKCAYCALEAELLIEHAIPINKEKLGEHKLGNVVPSCKTCNSRKAGKDFREFLGDDTAAIEKIEQYMDSRNYVPLEDNEQIKMILNMAYKEVGFLAERYVTIINELFSHSINNYKQPNE
ncbi:HNH endonuclease [Iodobacter ciconiae]|uniref:HNH endonuclease n=1 Tax=Iodobacter ciconiae TaxID=2496266 RepID=A0A3S8ZP26_9NEIS|nr:HNH endonuclease [Iodobacter ciconiae]AZN35111.1 HNH endonuclease [Iodobacter ciconiae]